MDNDNEVIPIRIIDLHSIMTTHSIFMELLWCELGPGSLDAWFCSTTTGLSVEPSSLPRSLGISTVNLLGYYTGIWDVQRSAVSAMQSSLARYVSHYQGSCLAMRRPGNASESREVGQSYQWPGFGEGRQYE